MLIINWSLVYSGKSTSDGEICRTKDLAKVQSVKIYTETKEPVVSNQLFLVSTISYCLKINKL